MLKKEQDSHKAMILSTMLFVELTLHQQPADLFLQGWEFGKGLSFELVELTIKCMEVIPV